MSGTKACIFNIQKFSLHDGPGIRTIVFFKGCPLRCKWCANPESLNEKINIIWDSTKCISCEKCTEICPVNAICKVNNKVIIDDDKCTGCIKCVKGCPENALETEGEYYDVQEVVKEIIKDKVFYDESGGGVTLSGGEVLLQHEFAIELLKEMKKLGIHTAIETTGYAEREVFEELIKYVDLILFDLKHYDEDKHVEWTGVSNKRIKENLNLAILKGKEIIPRIPVIPGFNNSIEDANKLADFLAELNFKNVELLPFHQFGESKYEKLGIEYHMKGVRPIHDEDLKEYKTVFLEKGINCK
jgi:pyruvate formate lyase activating enzyme